MKLDKVIINSQIVELKEVSANHRVDEYNRLFLVDTSGILSLPDCLSLIPSLVRFTDKWVLLFTGGVLYAEAV